jgi:AcrR family transcriptional regulator
MQTRPRPRAPASPAGRAQQKAATREALLAAARRVIATAGFDRATTRAVAAEAGVAVGTVFAHFPDVGALAEALLDEHIGAALARAERTRPRKGDVVTRLVHVARALYDSYDVDPRAVARVPRGVAVPRRPRPGPRPRGWPGSSGG